MVIQMKSKDMQDVRLADTHNIYEYILWWDQCVQHMIPVGEVW